MLKFFSKYKIIFYFLNFCVIFLYIFPGSLIGFLLYGNIKMQPQITPDFIVSSNHFYTFVLLSVIGFLTFNKFSKIKKLTIYLIILSIILEVFHLIIPERSFQWQDLFGNLLGVIVVILISEIINKYELYKK
tara:strand:+ start:45 stop:440 length:396 start_codon:yes stop_codon:yes gene_type:complete